MQLFYDNSVLFKEEDSTMESKASNAEYKSFIGIVKKLPNPPNLPSLYDTFWLMRISPHQFNQMKENHPKNTALQKVDKIKTNIREQYEKDFYEQFENSITSILDNIYENRRALMRQFKKIYLHRDRYYQKDNTSEEIRGLDTMFSMSQRCQEIVVQIHKTFIFIPRLFVFFAELEESTCQPIAKKPSQLGEFDKIIHGMVGNSGNNVNKTIKENGYADNAWNRVKKNRSEAMKTYPRIKEGLKKLLLETKSNDFAKLREICEKECGTESEIVGLLTSLQYLEFTTFNLETIFIFLFLHEKTSDNVRQYKMIDFVVDRTEQFFLDLYDFLQQKLRGKSDLMQVLFDNAVPQDVVDSYVPLLGYETKIGLSFFDLKKLTSFFLTYTILTHSKNPFYNYADHFNRVLSVTKLTHIAYNSLFDDPMEFIKKHYGLQQKEVADILEVAPETLSRQKKTGKLYSKHAWFWQLLTGCTDTYLRGKTTIPRYGKNDEESITFKQAVFVSMPYPDIFLDRVRVIKDYLLEKESKTKKKYMLSENLLQSVMKKIIKLVEEIRWYRINIDKLYEKWRMCKREENFEKLEKFEGKLNTALHTFSFMIKHCIAVSYAYNMFNDSGEDITALKKSLRENRKQLNKILSQYKSIISDRK